MLLAACGSRSSSPPADPHAPAVDFAANAQKFVQMAPAPKPGFDPGIHDYVIDCNSTPSVDLTVVQPNTLGFTFLGTTSNHEFIRPTSDEQFRQTVQINPGERVEFLLGSYGSYSVRCLPSGFPPLSVSTNGSSQAEWYVFAPDIGASQDGSYVIIADSHGTPVWWMQDPGNTIVDAKVLDSNHIVWAISNDTGSYYVRTFSGERTNTLTDALDFHELQPTGNGTYLAIRTVVRTCPPDCADLSPWGGGAQVAAVDAEIVELDENSNELWTWRTRDHIALSETGGAGWLATFPSDIIHMNAIEPDGPDGLMFSARHLNAVYRIIKSTGAIDWKIGGTPRPESLTVVGDVRPTAVGPNGQALSGQHDIRRWPDGTISVHDNGTLVGRQPSIMRYRLDLTNRTAEVVQEIHDDRVPYSICCGSARLLPGGNWVVQWGATPFVTELDASGNEVLTINYNLKSAFSYRSVPVANGMVLPAALRAGMDAMYVKPPAP